MIGVLYCVKNKINGKEYIGQTVHFKRRIRRHVLANESDSPLYRAIKKYGWSNFQVIKMWEGAITDSSLNKLEIEMISLLNTKTPNGYNLTDGGSGGRGYKFQKPMSIERRQKLRLANLGKPSPMKGIKQSKESCEKMSIAHAGVKLSEAHRKAQGDGRRGKPHGNKGLKQSDEWIEKKAGKLRGKKRPTFSEEWKANISKAQVGRKLSEEHKEKIRQALLRRKKVVDAE